MTTTNPLLHELASHHSTLRNRPRSRRLAGAGVAMLTLSLGSLMAACGDDDAEASSVSAAACDAAVALGTAMGQAPQDPAEFAGFAQQQLVPVGDTLVAELDGDARTAAETLAAAYTGVAETGDPSALFEDADVMAATATVGALVHDECDLQSVDIGAIEYAYVGAPATLDAGRVSFALENTGVEEHEMVLLRRNDDNNETLDQLLELPEDELFSKVAFMGVAFGGPGTTTYTAIDLEPGTYFLVCMIPQAEDGPPHVMAGMRHTFVVS